MRVHKMTTELNEASGFICVGIFFIVFAIVMAYSGYPLILLLGLGGLYSVIYGIKILKRISIKELVKRNQYIYAEFDSVKYSGYIDKDGLEENICYAVFRYDTGDGKYFYFKSEEYNEEKDIPYYPGASVKVFVDLSYPEIYMITSEDYNGSDGQICTKSEPGHFIAFYFDKKSILNIFIGLFFIILFLIFFIPVFCTFKPLLFANGLFGFSYMSVLLLLVNTKNTLSVFFMFGVFYSVLFLFGIRFLLSSFIKIQ